MDMKPPNAFRKLSETSSSYQYSAIAIEFATPEDTAEMNSSAERGSLSSRRAPFSDPSLHTASVSMNTSSNQARTRMMMRMETTRESAERRRVRRRRRMRRR
jgi:hypothetical protein